jgi:hypothetical protein
MPRTSRTLTSIMLAAMVALLALSAALAGNSDVTTGQFLVAIAKEANVGAADPVAAAEALRSAGYPLPKLDPDKPLTEGTVAVIANALGLRVTTQSPDAAFGSGQVAAFLGTFGRDLGSRAGSRPDIDGTDPSTKGKKKGHHKSSSEPL